ncbi:hypothetical protein BWO90_08715 (plasmid) [Sinorhizobium meliloti]|nr:hypothetical protein BWO90_08715 [Sinorhizobium meliloti]
MLQPMISMRIIGSESIDGQLVRSSFDTASPDRLRQRPFIDFVSDRSGRKRSAHAADFKKSRTGAVRFGSIS